ncbi:mucin-7-like [Pseudorasbora parva]|uniref:mucin-7-like n=1 Tax=Pseudorasbora parva TaxID=51549 RepID=UPI00351E08BA
MQDISALLQNDSLPCPKATVKNFNISTDASAQQRPCAASALPTTPPNSTTPAKTSTRAPPRPTEGALPTTPPNSTTPAKTSTRAPPRPTEGALLTPKPNSATTATTSTRATPGPTERPC